MTVTMRKKSSFTPWTILFILLSSSVTSFSQLPDDINGRLWRLCKVWGFAKYYHQHNCDVNWNDLLIKAIDSTIVSTSNNSFNVIINEMLASAGQVSHATDSLVLDADINLNAHFEWIDDPYFSQEVKDILDSVLINFRPKENCMVIYNDGSYPGFGGWLSFGPDNILSVPFFTYTKESNRLLTLFYYWNIINYFHPEKGLMDQNWDTTLLQFIPLIREAENDEEFHLRFLNLVTYLDDSHGFTGSQVITDFFGDFYPLLEIGYVQGQTAVKKVGPAISTISVGDIIRKINGIDIEFLRDSMASFIPASNENTLNRDLDKLLLTGQFSTNLHIELEDANGSTYSETLFRSYSSSTYYDWIHIDPKPIWEITSCGYGYVNMGKLYPGHVHQMYEDLKDTPAIIFDVRNYPNGTIYNLIPYLFPGPVTYALFTNPDLTTPGWYSWSDNREQGGSFSNANPYSGKVIILVNAETQSHGEYTVMGLQQHPNAYTIGSQTAGADGNISYLTLPGSLYTYWTSLGISYPDTITAQRVGVRIDSVVNPTIEGFRNGEDEVLAKAFDCLTNTPNEAGVTQGFSLQPNPADDLIYVSFDMGSRHNVQVKVSNLLGQQIFQQNINAKDLNQFHMDVSPWMDGIYIVTLSDDNGTFGSEKIYIQR